MPEQNHCILLPCPKCGGRPLRRMYDPGPTNSYRKWIECASCGHKTETYLVEDFQECPADDEWNNRL